MPKAIRTHCIPATNTKPRRIKAVSQTTANDAISITVKHQSDHADSGHRLAAETLRRQLNWPPLTGHGVTMVAGVSYHVWTLSRGYLDAPKHSGWDGSGTFGEASPLT